MKKYIATLALFVPLCAFAQQPSPQTLPSGVEYLSNQLKQAQHDVAVLLDENNVFRKWHDECVKDFKKCEAEYTKAKAEADKQPSKPVDAVKK